MKVLTIDVTQQDIDQGDCASMTKCAIARSLGRMVDGISYGVGASALSIRMPDGKFENIILPRIAQEFIQEFDHKLNRLYKTVHGEGLPKPFSFQLELSDELYSRLFGPEISVDNLSEQAACLHSTTVPMKSEVVNT